VANHQPQAVEQGLELLLDATRQAELQTVEQVTAAERERRERARLWERELCFSALILHGSPAACLGTDRQTAKTVEPLLLDRSDKAARALLVGLAANASMVELAALRTKLVAALRTTVQPGRKTVASCQGWAHQHGNVHYWQESPAERRRWAVSRAVQLDLPLSPTYGQDAYRPWITRIEATPGSVPHYLHAISYKLVTKSPDCVAPHKPNLDIERLILGPPAVNWWLQYPELYRETHHPVVEQPLGLWHRYSPSALAINPLLPNIQAPRTVVAAAPRQGWVHQERQPITNWDGEARAALQYLDALMEGPGLLARMASEWGAIHFIALECRRLRRWGTESDEAALAAVGCVPSEVRLLTGLSKCKKYTPCLRKKCRKGAEYYDANYNAYCREHMLQVQTRKENSNA
jgi:hypothetical protein